MDGPAGLRGDTSECMCVCSEKDELPVKASCVHTVVFLYIIVIQRMAYPIGGVS